MKPILMSQNKQITVWFVQTANNTFECKRPKNLKITFLVKQLVLLLFYLDHNKSEYFFPYSRFHSK